MSTPLPILGKTFTEVVQHGDDEIVFKLEDGSRYLMHHNQSCCEDVFIESVVGDLNDLAGEPLLIAEEVTNEPEPKYGALMDYGSYTWTFYKFATRKGYVDIRWYGTSNGYYSESVDIDYQEKDRK